MAAKNGWLNGQKMADFWLFSLVKAGPFAMALAMVRSPSKAKMLPPKAVAKTLAEAMARALAAEAVVADQAARIALLEWQNAQMKRALYGTSSERTSRLLDQLELALEDAQANAAEAEARAKAAAEKAQVPAYERKRPARKPFADHIPRERVELPVPEACTCCGSDQLSRIGEVITETLKTIPRQWRVVQTVRPKVSCRACQTIMQPPAPFHVTPRGWAGASFLAMIAFEKYGQHQPLNRQRDRYALEGVDLSLSTLADQIGAIAVAVEPLHALIQAHVLAADRLHGDDTTVPLLAKTQTSTSYFWSYVRDDRPFGGPAPPAAWFCYTSDRCGKRPEEHLKPYGGILQADAYSGFNPLFAPERPPGAVARALCWAHARRKFFEIADIKIKRGKKAGQGSPLAREAVERINALFAIESAVNGKSPAERLAARTEHSAPLVADLKAWMDHLYRSLSTHDPLAKAINYLVGHWDDFTRFLADGRICLTNNAAERSLRGVALGRKSWLFVGSDRGGQRAAVMYSLIQSAKLNGIDPQAWLTDVLERIAEIPQSSLPDLLPWNWKAEQAAKVAANESAQLDIAA
jgi:transposase